MLFQLLTSCATMQQTETVAPITSTSTHKAEPPPPQQETVATRTRWKLMYHTLLAELAFKRQLYEQALSNYRYVLKFTDDLTLVQKATVAALHSQSWHDLQQLSDRWQQQQPLLSTTYYQLIAQLNLEQADALQNYNQYFSEDTTSLESLIQRVALLSKYLDAEHYLLFLQENHNQFNKQAKISHLIMLQQHQRYAAFHQLFQQDFAETTDIRLIQLNLLSLSKQAKPIEMEQYLAQRQHIQPDNNALRTLQIEVLIRHHQLDAAIQSIVDLLNVSDQHIKAQQARWHSILARLQLENGLLDDSYQIFSKLYREMDYQDISAYYLGIIHQQRQQTQQATQWFLKVAPKSAQFSQAQNELFNIYMAQQQYQKAHDALIKSNTQNPAHAFTQKYNQLRLQFATQPQQAQQHLLQLIEKHPRQLSYRLMATGLMATQLSSGELQHYMQQHLQQLNSIQTQQQFLQEASSLLGETHLDDIYTLLHPLTEQHITDLNLRYFRGLTAQQLNKPQQFQQDLSAILQQQPNDARALNAFGYFLLEQGDLTQAEHYIQQAYQLNPTDAATIDSLGWLYFHLDQLDKAEYYLQTAYRLNDNIEIAIHLIQVLWKSKQFNQADQLLHKLQRTSTSPLVTDLLQQLK